VTCLLNRIVQADTAVSMLQFLATKNMAATNYPPSTPDMAPCDLFLIPRMKSQLQGHHFQDVPEIREQLLIILHVIPKNKFQLCSGSCRKAGLIACALKGKTMTSVIYNSMF
jgi:hypothetical protein